MLVSMKHLAAALSGILDAQGRGSASALQERSGLAASLISNIRAGNQLPELYTLARLVEHIGSEEAQRALTEAYIWDVFDASGCPGERFRVVGCSPDDQKLQAMLDKVGRLARLSDLNRQVLTDFAALWDAHAARQTPAGVVLTRPLAVSTNARDSITGAEIRESSRNRA
jgi:hypothetical protein